ncbi:MAG TPA: aldo/keto reductase [Terriglobia bacterium]|nr:aldo/keto reductase [Terriglobia bacterium]
MVFRPLGKTDILVSRLGLGTVKVGRNQAVKYPAPYPLPSDHQLHDLLSAALALGLNLIDTAPAYGESEVRLSPFVGRHRDQIVLCTKAGEGFEHGQSIYDFSPAAILASATSSLRRLNVDALDILLLHSDGNDRRNILSAAPALSKLKADGKVRAIGISAKTEEGVLSAVQEQLDVVMAPFSMANPSLGPALANAHRAGLGVIAIKGLQSGSLSARIEKAVQFVLDQPFIDSLVIGTTNPDHLDIDVRLGEALPTTYSDSANAAILPPTRSHFSSDG